jgi:DNA-binding NtrC family response regulator
MRILIVDDEETCLDDVSAALLPTGYDCLKSNSSKKALKMVKADASIDVVITDVRMPEMDGIELLKAIKKVRPSVEVIVMTAYGDLKTAIASINNRAYAFFAKPVNFPDLIDTLAQIEKELSEKGKPVSEHDYERLREQFEGLKENYHKLLDVLTNKARSKNE